MKQWPTVNGIAIPLEEIWLPESNLDLTKRENFNNHHLEYTARTFGRSILLQVVRNLDCHQELIPLDVHDYIHRKYSDTEPPTPRQAMDEIYRAYHANEQLHCKEGHTYVYSPITQEVLKRCIANYNKVKNW